jgi:hypothetical protein
MRMVRLRRIFPWVPVVDIDFSNQNGVRTTGSFLSTAEPWQILYRETVGRKPLTPAEVAHEYSLPIDAVLEAIHYCEHNAAILDEDRRREAALIKQDGRDRWPHTARESQPDA